MVTERRPLPDLAFIAALLGLAAGVRLGVALAFGADVPLGSDPPIWGLSALAWWHEGQLEVPPLFPVLTALLASMGTVVGSAGLGVARAAGLLVPPIVYLGVRAPGGSPPLAFAAGLVACFIPDLVVESLTFQPESLTTLLFGLAAASMLWWSSTARRSALFGFALTVALLGLAREHGLLVLVPAALVVGAAAPPGRARWMAPVLVLLLAQLAPALLGVSPLRPPGTWPWAQKATVILEDIRLLQGGFLPSYLQNDNDSYPTGREAWLRQIACAYADLGPEPLLRAMSLNLARALTLSGDLYLALVTAFIGAALWGRRLHRPALAWTLPAIAAALLPSLLVWSQRRHASVFIGVALVGQALGWGALSASRARWVFLGVALLGWTGQLGVALEVPGWLRAQSTARRAEATLGLQIAAAAAPNSVIATQPELIAHAAGIAALYAELPFLLGEVEAKGAKGDWVWRAVLIVDSEREDPPRPDWVQVGTSGATEAWVYRPEVTGIARPSPSVEARSFPIDRGVRPLLSLEAVQCVDP